MARPIGSKNYVGGVKAEFRPVGTTKFIRDNLYRLTEGARTRSKAHNVPCDSASDLMAWLERNLTDKCPVLGIEMECGKGSSQKRSPTIHRIRPELGYVVGNIAIISRLANDLINIGDVEASAKAIAAQTVFLANGGPR